MNDFHSTNLFIERVVFLHWYGPMIESKARLLKKGAFKGMEYVCARKYRCKKGEITLTEQNLTVKCGNHWAKTVLPMKNSTMITETLK